MRTTDATTIICLRTRTTKTILQHYALYPKYKHSFRKIMFVCVIKSKFGSLINNNTIHFIEFSSLD